ncbi:MAG: hypothetical protein HXX13_15335 [Bacteroidetes bacterium]|nr:hypothetical protein [Bacteroidota bacterium]
MKYFLSLFVLLLLFSACKKEKTTENPYSGCPYGQSFVKMESLLAHSEGMIPFQLGLSWNYADSTWENGILKSAGRSSIFVVSAEKSGSDYWWKLSDGNQLCTQNDTVYKLNINGMVPERTTACPEKTILFYPVPDGPAWDWYEISGDMVFPGEASVYDGIIHTEIGDFENCYQFKRGNFTRIIQPGVGIVKIITIDGNLVNEKTLLNYMVSEQ